MPCPVSNLKGDAYSKSIQTTVRSHYPQLRACYERSLHDAQALDAATPDSKVSVYSEVGPGGEVFQARLVNVTLPDPKFQTCMLDAYREMRFEPPPGGNTTFVYPILFSPGH